MNKFSNAAMTSAVVLLLSASDAPADKLKGDGKAYSGLGCTESPNGIVFPTGPNPYGTNDVRYNSVGWAYNSSSTESIIVSCQIVREHVHLFMKRAWVTVLNNTDEDVICEIEAFTEQGAFLEQSSPFIFKPSIDGVPETGFKSNDKNDDDGGPFDNSFEFVPQLSNPGGYYILQCLLPPAGYTPAPGGDTYDAAFIIRYVIEEVLK